MLIVISLLFGMLNVNLSGGIKLIEGYEFSVVQVLKRKAVCLHVILREL